MKILLVIASVHEATPLLNYFKINQKEYQNFKSSDTIQYSKKLSINLLVTGVGIPNTIYNLTKHLLENTYDLVINIGVAGSFSRELKINESVIVKSNTFADIGAESPDQFIPLKKLKIDNSISTDILTPNSDLIKKIAALLNIKKVNAATVNKSTGTLKSISLINPNHFFEIETMEGAACFYVCILQNIPILEIRNISNYIEKRNTLKWKLKQSIDILTDTTLLLIKLISEKNIITNTNKS